MLQRDNAKINWYLGVFWAKERGFLSNLRLEWQEVALAPVTVTWRRLIQINIAAFSSALLTMNTIFNSQL